MGKSHSGGPGVETRGGVTSTMNNPMKASSSPGSGNRMKAPFDAESRGAGAIPTTVTARGITAPKVPAPTQSAVLGAQGGQKRPGTK